MTYIQEIYLDDEGMVVDSRESSEPFVPVMVGDNVYAEFDNEGHNESYGNWFTVTRRRVYLFTPTAQITTVRLYLSVSTEEGAA